MSSKLELPLRKFLRMNDGQPLSSSTLQPHLLSADSTIFEMTDRRKENVPPSPSSSPGKRHQRGSSSQSSLIPAIPHSTAASSSAQSAINEPYTEPNPNPNLPNHFDATFVLTCIDPNDPDYLIYESIEENLDSIMHSVEPYLSCAMVNYGIIGLDFDEEGYNPYKNPRLLVIQLHPNDIHRWQEVDHQVRHLIVRTYQRNGRPVPPIRYISGGFQTLANPITSSSTSVPEPDTSLAHNQVFQKEMGMGHSIGVGGDDDLVGTIGCILQLQNQHGQVLPDLFGLTCHHVISDDDRPIQIDSRQPMKVCAPASVDLARRRYEADEKIRKLRQELVEISSSEEKLPTARLITWQDEKASQILGRRRTKATIREALANAESNAKNLEQVEANKAVGTVFCSSGVTLTDTIKIPDDPANKRFAIDWALIKLNKNRQGINQLPVANAWPTSLPPAFDILKAHRQVHSCAAPTPKEAVIKNGRTTGVTHGFVTKKRQRMDYPPITPNLVKNPIIGWEYMVSSSQLCQVFAWGGDSGSAVVNRLAHFLGMVICANLLQRRMEDIKAVFTPAEILFSSIREVTHCTVTWAAPTDMQFRSSAGNTPRGRSATVPTTPGVENQPFPGPSHSGAPSRERSGRGGGRGSGGGRGGGGPGGGFGGGTVGQTLSGRAQHRGGPSIRPQGSARSLRQDTPSRGRQITPSRGRQDTPSRGRQDRPPWRF
ncbi:MAG: hypothetical protein Q9170_005604 [Blastenia crenularia]